MLRIAGVNHKWPVTWESSSFSDWLKCGWERCFGVFAFRKETRLNTQIPQSRVHG